MKLSLNTRYFASCAAIALSLAVGSVMSLGSYRSHLEANGRLDERAWTEYEYRVVKHTVDAGIWALIGFSCVWAFIPEKPFQAKQNRLMREYIKARLANTQKSLTDAEMLVYAGILEDLKDES